MERFAAIDFETADDGRDSACALAIVVAEGETIVREASFLIRPPRSRFRFTEIHGITWADVADQPCFADHWPAITDVLDGVGFLAAHNAGFDRSVLYQCCHAAGLDRPTSPFLCTMQLARRAWALAPARLPDVCRHLRIELQHHKAESDARACAEIVLAARRQGRPFGPWMGEFRGRLIGAGEAAVSATVGRSPRS